MLKYSKCSSISSSNTCISRDNFEIEIQLEMEIENQKHVRKYSFKFLTSFQGFFIQIQFLLIFRICRKTFFPRAKIIKIYNHFVLFQFLIFIHINVFK